ncbi:hypothetical protein F2P81_003380 [Scophthalmus maximus]|uniref:Phosphatidic acid phosphatase type 2/haloperoxidase domain-containing protein n=1 Tax=Scophthalmus maximus TaxID=52904 RepID=A0A6A4TQD3_SCOMX|nr:hypothetical protein F2P81_003380 [Scophthalmus maximus]
MVESDGLVEPLRCLQDPHLVARFQRLCGVRGTFSRSVPAGAAADTDTCGGGGSSKAAERTRTHDNGAWSNHITAGEDSEREGLAVVGAAGAGGSVEATAGGVRRRITDCGVDTTRGDRGSGNAPQNGAVAGGGAPVAPRSGTVKPLRRNSLTGDAGQEFLIENRLLYYLFTLGTELGNEFFYTAFFPFVIWNLDAFVGRRLIMVWVWVMYLGQCTKDVVGWPRPASPPVVKYPPALGFALALCWCLLVCVSRIYMGMHSVLDVIVGVLYSVLILLFVLPALDLIDDFNLTCRYAPLIIISFHLGLGLFCFTLDTWSTSRSDTAQILGTGAGIALASHLNHCLGLLPDPTPDQLPLAVRSLAAGLVATVLLRLVLGVLVLMATRELMKAATIPLVCRLFGVPGGDVRKARQHMEVELPYRYIVYGTVGFNVVFLVPLLFSYVWLS